ncbi:MAG TPA: hypothetical protein VGS41_04450 [Chthonomonadales bacterium]|nr:hypothetical protein [Chthonomonadales bacterium]
MDQLLRKAETAREKALLLLRSMGGPAQNLDSVDVKSILDSRILRRYLMLDQPVCGLYGTGLPCETALQWLHRVSDPEVVDAMIEYAVEYSPQASWI